ncbi:MAG: C40 family peptidase [Caldimonas sp.]
MSIRLAAPPRPILRMAIALVLGLAACQAFAAPGEAADPLMKLIAEHASASEPADEANQPPVAKPSLLRQAHDKATDMVLAAMNFVGVRYKRGGVSAETGFDCSGFTRHVFEMSLGLVLPRRADEQAAAPGLVAVKREDLKPGDLVFFNTLKRTFSHVGIYIGDNRFIHSPRPGERVRTENMSFAYWTKRFTGARRAEAAVLPAPAAPTATPGAAVAGE